MSGFFSYLPQIEYTPTRTQFQFTNQDFVVAANIFKGRFLRRPDYLPGLGGTRPIILDLRLAGRFVRDISPFGSATYVSAQSTISLAVASES